MAERKPSELRSSYSMIIPDRQDFVVRMSCCAASDWFTEEEKGGVEMRSISLRVLLRTVVSRRRCALPRQPRRQRLSRGFEREQHELIRAWRGHHSYDQATKKLSRGCYVHHRRVYLPLAAHDIDVGALAAVFRGAGGASSVGAFVHVSPVASSVAAARGVAVSPLPAAPLRRPYLSPPVRHRCGGGSRYPCRCLR